MLSDTKSGALVGEIRKGKAGNSRTFKPLREQRNGPYRISLGGKSPLGEDFIADR